MGTSKKLKEFYREQREKLLALPVTNEQLYKETAWKTGLSPKQVEEIFLTCTQFIADVIKEGSFETVMIPNFGKFIVKTKQVQYYETFIRGNETIRIRREQRSKSEQALDSVDT